MEMKEEGEWESTEVPLVQLLEFEDYTWLQWAFPGGAAGKEPACNAGDLGSIPGSGRSHGEGSWQTPPVSLPGKSHEQGSLAGCSPSGLKELGTTERLTLSFTLVLHTQH